MISHLHALTRNEPARAVVTDKFNTFTLEQELNMDETLREFFNDVYEITRQIPRGKVLTYGRIAAQLESEGVTFRANGCVDMKKHLWEILTAPHSGGSS